MFGGVVVLVSPRGGTSGYAAAAATTPATALGAPTGSSTPSGSEAAAVAATATAIPAPARPALENWYAGNQRARDALLVAVRDVRQYVAAKDGLALRQACATLSTRATAVLGGQPAPETSVDALWQAGATSFSDAATECGHLWDGTAQTPDALLRKTVSFLDTASGQWRSVATQLGQPEPTAPPAG